jgi:hypothetical protein
MAQKENERRRTSKQAHAPRANYLLSGKLFCGRCKQKMVGVSGTGKAGGKFYYYYCSAMRAKKGCDKKQIRKDLLENLVVTETLNHILKPNTIKYIAKACYEIQLRDNSRQEETEFLRRRIADNKKALDNTLKAIETGVETTTLPLRLKELEAERIVLAEELKDAEAKTFILTPEHIEFLLLQYAKKGEDEHTYKREIIESFVSEVYLYDDKILIYYNINKDQPTLARSDLSLIEAGEFDQHDPSSTKSSLLPFRRIYNINLDSLTFFQHNNLTSLAKTFI